MRKQHVARDCRIVMEAEQQQLVDGAAQLPFRGFGQRQAHIAGLELMP